MIENGMIIGAAAQYDASCAWGEALDSLTSYHLEQLLADDGSVEEAIAQNADVVLAQLRTLTAHPEQAVEVARFVNGMIRSYLEPVARAAAERDL